MRTKLAALLAGAVVLGLHGAALASEHEPPARPHLRDPVDIVCKGRVREGCREASWVSGGKSLPAFAPEAEPAPTESLAQALADAYRTAPALQAQRYQLRANDEDYALALSELRPTTQLQVTGAYNDTVAGRITQASRFLPTSRIITSNTMAGTVSFSQPLYTGGKAASDREAALAEVGAGRALLRGTEADLLLQVISAYADVRRDSEALRLYGANVHQLEATLDEVKARREAGELTRTDIAQADTQLALARSQFNSTTQQLQQDRASFAMYVGRDPGVLAPLPPLPGVPGSVDEALDLAYQLNPGLEQAIAAERSSRAKINAAKAQDRPTLSLTGSATLTGRAVPFYLHNEDQQYAGQAVLTIPLTNGGRVGALVAQAEDRNAADRIGIEGARRQMVDGIVSAWNGMATAERNIDVGTAGLAAAKIFDDGSFQEYRAGLRSTFDVLYAHSTLLNAEVTLVVARHDLYVAEASLLRQIGLLEARSLLTGTGLCDPQTNFAHAENRGALPIDPLVRGLDPIARPEVVQHGLAGQDADRTVFAPADPTPQAATAVSMRPPEGGIKIGDILNHIFEVKKYIARGGMGEVYEGVNINTDERVAIKVMLPALAADANVQAMFRKEAKTLTRLSHPAVVQYRVLAQEPQLGVLYIVTDFISGTNLSDVLGSVPRDADSLMALTRRLAEGLAAAHALGAVHRDISPDNVLLEDGKLERARIIDFGIAKDLDPAKGTIVGDGFAGKLNYVAPEQLGDFGREVGPWSDVYSLALVILALARGKDVALGDSLVDAVDKRRAGIDVSEAPEEIRPILEAMLRPNPKERLRSMEEVIAAINARFAPEPVGGIRLDKRIVLGAIAALVAIGGGTYYELTAPSAEQSARAAVVAALPQIGCSWLDLRDLKLENGALSLRFDGVAGSASAAQSSLTTTLAAQGLHLATVDFSNVAPISATACPTLDAYRAIKSAQGGNLMSQQASYAMQHFTSGHYAGQTGAVPKIQIAPNLLKQDVSLIGIESDGSMSVLLPNAATLKAAVSADPETGSINPDGSIILKGFVTTAGWSGILAVSGKGPFDPALVAPASAARGASWRASLSDAAKARGWSADMVWFKIAG